jgi:ABC-2 type transport system permease protein
MRAFVAFTKKEFTENLRTWRTVLLAAVFFLFGVMSPLIAKMTPELLRLMADTGLVITLPEPTAMDSWAQFFKNTAQLGMLALVITFSGIMAGELSTGTLVNLLTKGMMRHTVILSKFLTASLLWAGAYLLCLLVCYVYTAYYWPAEELANSAPWAFLAPWLFGEFLIALLVFGGTLFGNLYGSLLTCGGVIVALNLLNIIPRVQGYNPVILAGDTLSLLSGQKELADFLPALLICATATALLIAASILIFTKKQV